MLQISKKMKKHILTATCSALIIGTLGVGYVKAQNSTILFVAPHRIVITPEQKIQVISVSNKSDDARRYAVSKVDQVMNDKGLTQQMETFEFSAKRMIRVVPSRFTLEPGERQTIRVMARRAKDLSDGDYHSHILFKEVPLTGKDKEEIAKEAEETKKITPNEKGGVSFEIKALYGVAVPIIVQQGQLTSRIEMASARVLSPEDGHQYVLDLHFKRSGNAEAAGFLSVEYVSGEQRTDLMPKQWIRMYREVDDITRNMTLSFPDGQDYQQGKIEVIFDRGYSDIIGEQTTDIDKVDIPFP